MSGKKCESIFKDLLSIVELSDYDAADTREVAQLFFVLWSNELFPSWLSANKEKLEHLYECLEDIVSEAYTPSTNCIRMINTYVKVIENNNLTSDLKLLPKNASMSDLLRMFITIMLHNTMWEIYTRSELIGIHDSIFECIEFNRRDIMSGLPMDPRVKKDKQHSSKILKRRDMSKKPTQDALDAYKHFNFDSDKGTTLSDLQKEFLTIMKSQVSTFGDTTRRLVRNHLASFLEDDMVRIRLVENCIDVTTLRLNSKLVPKGVANIILKQVEMYVLKVVFVDDDDEMKKNISKIPEDIQNIISKLV